MWPKTGEPSKFLKIIQPLEKNEVGIHSKNLLDTIDGLNVSTGETKTVFFDFALNSGTKKYFFLSMKILGKVGITFFSRNFFKFFCKIFCKIFRKFFFYKIYGLETLLG